MFTDSRLEFCFQCRFFLWNGCMYEFMYVEIIIVKNSCPPLYWRRGYGNSWRFRKGKHSISPSPPQYQSLGGDQKKMSPWGGLKEFLPWIFAWGRDLLCFVKKRLKNKIWKIMDWIGFFYFYLFPCWVQTWM